MRFAALGATPAGGVVTPNMSEAAIRVWGGIAALAAHGGLGFWLLSTSVPPTSDNTPPPAIMMEFSEAFEAARTQRNEITASLHSSQESRPVAKVDTPDESHPDRDDTLDDYLDPPDKTHTEAVRDNESPTHAAPSKPRKVVSKKPKEKQSPKEPPQAASSQSIEAQARVEEADRYAAPQSTAHHAAPSRATVTWQGRLLAHLERRKQYPYDARLRKETGTVYVRFSIDDVGKVLSVSIAQSSGFRALDNEVLSLVRRASPVPAPPADAPRRLVVPVQFSLK